MDSPTKTGIDAPKTETNKKTRKLHTTRKKTANNRCLKIVLALYKNGIPENYKRCRQNTWQCA